MRIVMLGIHHQNVGVALRERLALSGDALERFNEAFRERFPDAELVVLSTCNRMELYVARPGHIAPRIEQVESLLAEMSGVSMPQLRPILVRRENEQAVAHLFRVTAGLESMVLGEGQILGQTRRAYEHAANRQMVGPVLHRLFQQALATGKQIRTETGIGAGRVSIGSVAIDFARQIFERFDDKTVLGLGAGEMAKLVLRQFQPLKPQRLLLCNRSLDRATSLAEEIGLCAPSGGVRPWEDLGSLLVDADIVVASTGATEPILTVPLLKPLLRRRSYRPLFIIDLAVPRNVDEAVGNLDTVFVYNLDDLAAVVARTFQERGEEVVACEQLLEEGARVCMQELQRHHLGPLIRQLRTKLHDLGQAETQRMARKLAARHPEMPCKAFEATLQEHTRRLVNKILHLPLSQIDQQGESAPMGFYATALQRLFQLDNPIRGQEPDELADVPVDPAPEKVAQGGETPPHVEQDSAVEEAAEAEVVARPARVQSGTREG